MGFFRSTRRTTRKIELCLMVLWFDRLPEMAMTRQLDLLVDFTKPLCQKNADPDDLFCPLSYINIGWGDYELKDITSPIPNEVGVSLDMGDFPNNVKKYIWIYAEDEYWSSIMLLHDGRYVAYKASCTEGFDFSGNMRILVGTSLEAVVTSGLDDYEVELFVQQTEPCKCRQT